MDSTILAAIIVAVPASAAAVVGIVNIFKTNALHLLVNSRLTQLLAASGDAREAKGRREGMEVQRPK